MKMGVSASWGLVAFAAVAGSVQATVVDLTRPFSSGMVNDAIFETADFRPAGTGFIDSFVRIRMNGEEEGYNTSGRPVAFDELTDPNFTRNLRLSDLPVVSVGEIRYYEFLLDINESSSPSKSLLSVDKIQIFTTGIGSKTTSDIGSLGTLRYNLDTGSDNWIKLDYSLNSGSGQGDMAMLVPVSKFAGASSTDFVYLYSQFGTNHSAEAGFEEWSVRIPAPGPVVVAGAGALLMMGRRRPLN